MHSKLTCCACCSTVAGETAKIVTSMALDSDTIVAAPVAIGSYTLLGASSVVLPGANFDMLPGCASCTWSHSSAWCTRCSMHCDHS